MLDVFQSLFGYYEPCVYLASGSVEDGTAVYAAAPDLSYLIFGILLCILLYSLCRLVGNLFSRR